MSGTEEAKPKPKVISSDDPKVQELYDAWVDVMIDRFGEFHIGMAIIAAKQLVDRLEDFVAKNGTVFTVERVEGSKLHS
jgi:hypothetical protein